MPSAEETRPADKLVSELHSIFEFARREYQHGTNPAAAMERLPVRYDGGRFDFYTPEEVWAIVRAAKSEQDDATPPLDLVETLPAVHEAVVSLD